jgi:hypothetical protein
MSTPGSSCGAASKCMQGMGRARGSAAGAPVSTLRSLRTAVFNRGQMFSKQQRRSIGDAHSRCALLLLGVPPTVGVY